MDRKRIWDTKSRMLKFGTHEKLMLKKNVKIFVCFKDSVTKYILYSNQDCGNKVAEEKVPDPENKL